MGDTKWAIRNGRYEMGDTKWAIRNGYNLQLVIYFSKNESSVHTTVRGGGRTDGSTDVFFGGIQGESSRPSELGHTIKL